MLQRFINRRSWVILLIPVVAIFIQNIEPAHGQEMGMIDGPILTQAEFISHLRAVHSGENSFVVEGGSEEGNFLVVFGSVTGQTSRMDVGYIDGKTGDTLFLGSFSLSDFRTGPARELLGLE